MIGILPNPKKTIQIDKDVNQVAQAIEHIPLFSEKYKLFKANPTVNQYTFDALEFLSVGVYIDVNYSSITDDRTEITIEIRRKIGSFDKSVEITNANNHLSKVVDLIAESLNTDLQIRLEKLASIANEKEQKEKELQSKKDERQRLIQEAKKKAELEKQNNPVRYYAKQTGALLLTLGIVAGVIYLGYIFFK